MMFRKLYWVTEQVDTAGRSRVTGVYTSIPDLIRKGLHTQGRTSALRLTLAKLDSEQEPLGSWTSPRYEGLDRCLDEFVLTDEFSKEQCNALLDALHHIEKVAV